MAGAGIIENIRPPANFIFYSKVISVYFQCFSFLYSVYSLHTLSSPFFPTSVSLTPLSTSPEPDVYLNIQKGFEIQNTQLA